MNIIHTDDPKHAPINLDLMIFLSTSHNIENESNYIKFYLIKNTILWYFNSDEEKNICYEKILSLHSTNISKIIKL
jgi:hypothetical protein